MERDRKCKNLFTFPETNSDEKGKLILKRYCDTCLIHYSCMALSGKEQRSPIMKPHLPMKWDSYIWLHILCNIMGPKQTGRRLADVISKKFPWKKTFHILIQISLLIVPESSIDNVSSVDQVMAWYRSGGKTLPKSMINHFTDEYVEWNCIIIWLYRIILLKITLGI